MEFESNTQKDFLNASSEENSEKFKEISDIVENHFLQDKINDSIPINKKL